MRKLKLPKDKNFVNRYIEDSEKSIYDIYFDKNIFYVKWYRFLSFYFETWEQLATFYITKQFTKDFFDKNKKIKIYDIIKVIKDIKEVK